MKISKEVQELIIARIRNMPENLRLSLGRASGIDKYEMIEHVKKGDEIGNTIIKIQLTYLKYLKKGIING